MKIPFSKKVSPIKRVLGASEEGLGTFGGVFTPSILTILGVIMYLRFGWVVGNVGLIGTLLIVTLATSITFLTALSVASIATDQRVRVGGAYYMISRSLGIESGGAIGIPLFFALALSVALYTVGFAESIVEVFPSLNIKTVGIITTIGVAGLAMISAKAAIRAQYFIMFGIGLSLLSLLFGSPVEESQIEMFGAAERHSEGFWVVFAVFFPAVTGIMAGVNMSGDLKDPSKSIPRGTFAALGVGYVIYMVLPIILATRADALTLIEDPLIMRRMSYWGDAILIGVWGATLSSAVGSVLGAPRVLQALARDGVFPKWMRWLGRGDGDDDSPRVGTIITLIVALIAVSLGNLNIIAPILTMFFLTTYGVLNISAGAERLLGSPSFRPKFRVHWIFSLVGAIGCISVMILINTAATVIALLLVGLIYIWLERRHLQTTWGDVRRGIWMAMIRTALLRLSSDSKEKTWRPHPLVLSGSPTSRWHLIEFASSLTQSKGILTVATILTSERVRKDQVRSMEANIGEFLQKRAVQGLVRVISAPDPFEGAKRLVDSYGLGALVPNTFILGDSENIEHYDRYCDMIKYMFNQNRNVILIHDNKENHFGEYKNIDVWWGGLKGNGGLMILLTYMLQNSVQWRNANVTVKMAINHEQARATTSENLIKVLKKIRIEANIEIIVKEGRTFNQILHEHSVKADMIFLGMAKPDDHFTEYYKKIQMRLKNLPTVALVLAGEELSFGEILMQQDEFHED
ncbi:MAG: Na-K-Cl cotransporter [Balneolaceae bacterium]